ncbi:MAG: zf-HC2 domain-containing protein [Gammaproteobacteria bacterium]|nr:zf-HC2 domain-containing protein [Gammaproteobacteria bacterium]
MNCTQVALLLDEYSSGELPEVEADVLEDHLSGCPSCRRSLRQMRAIDDRIRGLPVDRAAEDFLPSLRATLAKVHPGLSREHTAPVAFLAEEAVVGDRVPVTATQMSFLRFTRVAA